MGGGYWRKEDFERYSAGMGRKVGADGHVDTSGMRGAQDMYRASGLDPKMDPYKVMRDLKTAASLNVIMQKILDEYEDVEFMVMGIGDLSYDRAPIQISQFESDIRIAEHLDRLWFERGGGGNGFESYTAAWYMGLYHTRLDCWEKGRKGILITIGDEPLNPYLPADRLAQITGDQVVRDVNTYDQVVRDVNTYALYRAVLEKYEIFHIAIDDKGDCYRYYAKDIQRSFGKLLRDRFIVSTLNSLPATILGCLETVREADAGTAAKPRMSLGKFLLTSNW